MPTSADFQKGLGAAQSGDFATALREWRHLAEQGDADAQYYLGLMYMVGQGVPRDYKTGFKWYTLSAEQGRAAGSNAAWASRGSPGSFCRPAILPALRGP